MSDCTRNNAIADGAAFRRPQAWQLLTEWTTSESLRKHALCVEACVAAMGEAEADRLDWPAQSAMRW